MMGTDCFKILNNNNQFCGKYENDQVIKLNIAHNEGNYFTSSLFR